MNRDDLLRTLPRRLQTAFPEGKEPIRRVLQNVVREALAELDALEEELSRKRDWLDAHRDDPRWAERRERFERGVVARHAHLASLVDTACHALEGQSYLWQHSSSAHQ